MRRALTTIVVTVVVCALTAPAASAEWSRARLMSADSTEQAFEPPGAQSGSLLTRGPDITADGRYVVFDTLARNLLKETAPGTEGDAAGGVFRKEVDTGALALVAPGADSDERALGAAAVDGEGRFVALESVAQLVPADGDTRWDVFVRDMTRPLSDPAALTMVSADETRDVRLPSSSSLSADGQRVLLMTPIADGSGTLALHDRRSGQTETISEAAFTDFPSVLSADGRVAAWKDADPRTRAGDGAYVRGEDPLETGPKSVGEYDPTLSEVLVGGIGSGAVRRLATAGDAADPLCPAEGAMTPFDPLDFGGPRSACDGIFAQVPEVERRRVEQVALSSDGARVAFVTAARTRTGTSSVDLFVRDYAVPGGSKAQTTQLTRFVGAASAIGRAGSPAISDDGRVVAFTSPYETSSLPSPSFVSSGIPGGVSNVLVLDLASGTVERVTRSYEAGPANDDAAAPALTADGRRVAFTSDATNLIFGDGNGKADVFVADAFEDRLPPLPPVGPAVQAASDAFAATEVRAAWRLSVTVSRGGTVLYVDARVPAAGRLSATARRSAGRGRPTLTRGSVRSLGPSRVRVRLRLPAKHRRAARGRGGLPVSITVAFKPSARGGTLTRQLRSLYRAPAKGKGTR